MAGSASFITEVLRIGPIAITNTVVVTWVIIGVLWLAAWAATRRLSPTPGPWQVAVEGVVSAIEDAVRFVLPDQFRQVMPFVATLWIFVLVANLASLIPGVRSPTGDLSLTAGLAILVFLAVHGYGIRANGLKSYLRHYLKPNPILLPFHVISEISRTVALAVRLFGNIFSLQMAALLVLLLAGFLVPIPVLMLHIIEALVQAYIFGMLALVYIAGAIQSQHVKQQKE
ncbi:MAG: F0F1 ATP synthase subunit A [Burkholderiaceae bacterium]